MAVLMAAVAMAGCGDDDDGDDDAPLSRTQVEERVAKEAPNTGGNGVTAECVELPEERQYRCGVKEGSSTGFVQVFVSKDGKRMLFKVL